MAVQKRKRMREKHIHLELAEDVGQLTCEDYLKMISLAGTLKGQVFFEMDSKQISLDVPEMYAEALLRALRRKGLHGVVSTRLLPEEPCFLMERHQ